MRILKTCIRFLGSIMSRIRFTIITNDRLWLYFSELAALACKSFFFFSSFVTKLAHIRVVHGARAAIAAWKCFGFWRTHKGTIAVLSGTVAVLRGISIAILLFAKFLNTKAMTQVNSKMKTQHEDNEEAHWDRSHEIHWIFSVKSKRMQWYLIQTAIKWI